MLLSERRQAIMKVLNENKTVSLQELVKRFNYSPATLRRDVAFLEESGLLYRTRGEIHWLDSFPNAVPATSVRIAINAAAKRRIALKAAEYVAEDSSVILDSGTTTTALAGELLNKRITAVTNSLEIAMILAQSSAQVISCGGLLQSSHLCFLGPDAERFLANIRADCLFLGTSGVRETQGLTTSSPLQYNIKQTMIASAKKRIALFDLSKLRTTCLFMFSDFSDIDIAITTRPEPGSPEERTLEAIGQKGVEIVYADDK